MKRKRLLFALLLGSLTASAETTTDYVSLSTASLTLGGSAVEVTASLNGVEERLYTGYQIDITLPDGVVPVLQYDDDAEEDVYCIMVSGLYKNRHSVTSSYLKIGGKMTLRVACTSSSNQSFRSTEGDLFTFKLQANAYAKPGTADIGIVNTKFGTYDSGTATTTQWIFSDATSNAVTVGNSASINVNISSTAKWSTCILPFAHSIPSGVTAYTSASQITEGGTNYLVLTPAATMEAYTPYVLYAESGWSGTLTGTVDASSYPVSGSVSVGNLNGAIVAQQVSTGYVLQNQAEGVKFYNMNGQTFSVPAGKCWVTVSNECKALGMRIDDADGIGEVQGQRFKEASIYDLGGRQVERPVTGNIYIRNGQKVLNVK